MHHIEVFWFFGVLGADLMSRIVSADGLDESVLRCIAYSPPLLI